ncbi:MAG: hypothetical protein J5953_07720 [Prevotella sp.]|nr:hypothetical protein [Prevotella sp.]
MKKILLSIVALCCTVVAGAQNEIVTAVLQHGDDVSVYKGGSAFVQAYNAAVDCDVITLSNGSFVPPACIEKVLSIYGCGFEEDQEANTSITTINGDLRVGKADAVLEGVHIEGVFVRGELLAANTANTSTTAQLKGFTLKKCFINSHLRFNSNIEGVTVKQCRIGGGIYGTSTVIADGLFIANCYIWDRVAQFSKDSDVQIDHCIKALRYGSGHYSSDDANWSEFTWKNSIIGHRGAYDGWGQTPLGFYSVAQNCIIVESGLDSSVTQNGCIVSVPINDLFDDGINNIDYSQTRNWKLKNETYLGTDGTPIGPYGGDGWNKVPSTPYVKNLNATVAGTNLNVSYEAGVR